MQFKQWLDLFGEAFEPHAGFEPLPFKQVSKVMASLLHKYFPANSVELFDDGLVLSLGERYLEVQVYNHRDRELGSLPAVEIEFQWRQYPKMQDRSPKEEDTPVLRQMRGETLDYAHRLRDFFREFSKYGVAVEYVPLGDRRTSWYSRVMSSAGYVEEGQDFWLPKAMAAEKESRRFAVAGSVGL